ncbi:hypothetical protein CULT_570027 [[Clostridium] ultunense Esp]|nr:hypothetical protein CULT_570027 [[Clostridium] ultunense Esp]
MKNYGVFDILGPVMIGPSSSHTAGAARLGKIGREIADDFFIRSPSTFMVPSPKPIKVTVLIGP